MKHTRWYGGLIVWIVVISVIWPSHASSQELMFESQEHGIRMTKEPSISGLIQFQVNRASHPQRVPEACLITTNDAVRIVNHLGEVMFEQPNGCLFNRWTSSGFLPEIIQHDPIHELFDA